MDAQHPQKPTVGSLFAGVGGFDLGFEQAGFATAWQVEINDINRAILADRFPHARQFADVRHCLAEAKSAGNAVYPPVARWIAQNLRAAYA